jgi:hypothetical protein
VTNNETVVSGLTDSSPVARATYVVAIAIDLQTPNPTDVSTAATEASDLTSKKRGGRPNGSIVGAINAQTLLVAVQRHSTMNARLRLPVSNAQPQRSRRDVAMASFAVCPKKVHTRKQFQKCVRNNTMSKGVRFQLRWHSAEPGWDES